MENAVPDRDLNWAISAVYICAFTSFYQKYGVKPSAHNSSLFIKTTTSDGNIGFILLQ